MKILDFLDKPSDSKLLKILYKVLVVALFVFIFFAAFERSMFNYTDHDDNPYMAGAKLTYEEGMIPYKDYRLIHMPYFVYTFAFILEFTSSLTFSARILSLISFLSILALIFYSIQTSLKHKNQIFKFLLGASTIIFLMFNPFVQYSFARFTYDFPLLLTILSFLSLISVERNNNSFLKAALSGLFLGIAIGFRMHFIFFTIPFAISLLLFIKGSFLSRFKLLIYFSVGVFTGLIPLLILFTIAPKEFIFDIFYFHFNIDMKAQPGASLPIKEKLSNLSSMLRENWQSSILIESIIVMLILKLYKHIKNDKLDFRINLLLLTLPFLVYLAVGKLLMIQYLYPLSVFLILTIFYGLCALKKYGNHAVILFAFLSILIIFGVKIKSIDDLSNRTKWYSLSRNHTSLLVDEATSGKVKVLTLSPSEIIENDSISIYKEFTSSPFIYRTSHLIQEDIRERYNIISKKEINVFLQKNQPEAILTGYYPEDLEMELINHAEKNDYRRIDLPANRELKLYLR